MAFRHKETTALAVKKNVKVTYFFSKNKSKHFFMRTEMSPKNLNLKQQANKT